LRKCLANLPFLALLLNHAKAGDGSKGDHQSRRWYYEAVPAAPMRKTVVDKAKERAQRDQGSERGNPRAGAAEPKFQPNAEKDNEAYVDHLFAKAADEKGALRIGAV